MSDVPITFGTGQASVATERIGARDFQIIKVVGAETGSTSVWGINPDRSALVSVVGVVNVNATGSIAAIITGTPSISGAINVSGSVLLGSSNASVIAVLQSSSIIGVVTGSVVAVPTGNQSVSGALFISGSVLSQQTGTVITSIVSSIPSSVLVGASIFGQLPAGTAVLGSIAALQGTNPWIINGSVSGAMNVSGSVLLGSSNASVIVLLQSSSLIAINAGSVVTLSTGSVITIWQSPSIVGTYAEDAASAGADKGIFMLGIRNDTIASFVSADLDYTARASDSAGRTLTKPFSPEESRVEGYNSVVSTSVTTLVAAAGTGLRNYITDIMVANTGATTTLVTFRSGGGTSVLGYTIAPTGGGSNMIGFATPLRTLANETFDFQPTSASSILFVTVKGFKAP